LIKKISPLFFSNVRICEWKLVYYVELPADIATFAIKAGK